MGGGGFLDQTEARRVEKNLIPGLSLSEGLNPPLETSLRGHI